MVPIQLLTLALSPKEILTRWEGRRQITDPEPITLSSIIREWLSLSQSLPEYLEHIPDPRDLLGLIPDFERSIRRLHAIGVRIQDFEAKKLELASVDGVRFWRIRTCNVDDKWDVYEFDSADDAIECCVAHAKESLGLMVDILLDVGKLLDSIPETEEAEGCGGARQSEMEEGTVESLQTYLPSSWQRFGGWSEKRMTARGTVPSGRRSSSWLHSCLVSPALLNAQEPRLWPQKRTFFFTGGIMMLICILIWSI